MESAQSLMGFPRNYFLQTDFILKTLFSKALEHMSDIKHTCSPTEVSESTYVVSHVLKYLAELGPKQVVN